LFAAGKIGVVVRLRGWIEVSAAMMIRRARSNENMENRCWYNSYLLVKYTVL